MAITTTPYGRFLLDLGKGVHDLVGDTLNVCLLKDTYTPDLANHFAYDSVTPFQIESQGGGGFGYDTGGITLTNKTFTYNATSKLAVLACDPVGWTNLVADTRYAVIYRVDSNSDQLLIGLIDFGATRSYSNEPFQLSFTNGAITLSA